MPNLLLCVAALSILPTFLGRAAAQGCSEPVQIERVSGSALACAHETLPQHGMRMDSGDSGFIHGPGGSQATFVWSASKQLLTISVESSGAFGCAKALAELNDFVRACARTNRVTNLSARGEEKWRIDNPEVREPWTVYNEIPLRPGELIHISSGGCVQTGGHGKTWVRYASPNGEAWHHGAVWPPDALRPLVLGPELSFRVPNTGPPSPFKLGFVDDDYSDNGYWGRDPGAENQCIGQGDAWAEVTITR